MTHEILFAGFGGQGVLSMGMMLAYAGMVEGKEVSWMPSYGPEMRGGTANCIVILSDHKISSPILTKFHTVVALNQPSIDKFEKLVRNLLPEARMRELRDAVLSLEKLDDAARLANLMACR